MQQDVEYQEVLCPVLPLKIFIGQLLLTQEIHRMDKEAVTESELITALALVKS